MSHGGYGFHVQTEGDVGISGTLSGMSLLIPSWHARDAMGEKSKPVRALLLCACFLSAWTKKHRSPSLRTNK